jgi:hypothetical protein
MTGELYRDLGLDYFDKLNKEHLQHSLVKRLEKLGNRVTLEPRGPAALSGGDFQGSCWLESLSYRMEQWAPLYAILYEPFGIG